MKKKNNTVKLLLILLLAISVGYAALSTTLKINGSATITKNNWSVYWNNVQVTEGSVAAATNIPSIGEDQNDPVNTKVTWSTTLNLPGDFYEFTVDAVNNGSIDAMITGITPSVTPALQPYISYSVTYANGVEIAENHLLPKKTGNTATVQTYKVRIEFLDTITPTQMNEIPEGGLSYTFSYQVTYGQASGSTIDPAGLIASCPGCVFEYAIVNPYDIWDDVRIYHGGDASVVTSYTTDYRELGKNVFLGYILDNSNTITRGFVCGIKNQTPFCLEGNGEQYDEENPLYNRNLALLQSSELWNGSCGERYGDYQCGEDNEYSVVIEQNGINIYDTNDDYCFIDYDGRSFQSAGDAVGCYSNNY